MLKKRIACSVASEANFFTVVSEMDQKLGKGGDIAAVDVPSTVELMEDVGRSCLSRADEQDRASGRQEAIDLTWNDRSAADVSLCYQADITRGEAFAQISPFHIWADLDRAKVVSGDE